MNIIFPAAAARKAQTVSRASPAPPPVRCRPGRTGQALPAAGSLRICSPVRMARGTELLVGHSRTPGILQQRAQGPGLPGSSAVPPGRFRGNSRSGGLGVLTGAAAALRCRHPPRARGGSAGTPESPRGHCWHPPRGSARIRRGSVRAPPEGQCRHPPSAGTARTRRESSSPALSARPSIREAVCNVGHWDSSGSPSRLQGGNCDGSCSGSARRRSLARLWREPKSRWPCVKFWRRDIGETGRQNHLRAEQAGKF